jgi:hypothetical protein
MPRSCASERAFVKAVRSAKAIDLWDAWLLAEADASLALRAWSDASGADKARSYAAYLAALDREERAGQVLADRVRRDFPRQQVA